MSFPPGGELIKQGYGVEMQQALTRFEAERGYGLESCHLLVFLLAKAAGRGGTVEKCVASHKKVTNKGMMRGRQDGRRPPCCTLNLSSNGAPPVCAGTAQKQLKG